MIVLDASAAVELLLATDRGVRIHARVAPLRIHVPELMSVEVLQTIRRQESRGDLSRFRAGSAIADLASLDTIRYRHDPLLLRAWDLRDNLSAYDALYVALAEVLDCPVVTCDGRLAGSTGHAADIELVN